MFTGKPSLLEQLELQPHLPVLDKGVSAQTPADTVRRRWPLKRPSESLGRLDNHRLLSPRVSGSVGLGWPVNLHFKLPGDTDAAGPSGL